MDRVRRGFGNWLAPFACVVILSLMAGCAKPPQTDIDGAMASLAAATQAEASDYAQASLRDAQTAKAALDAELAAQEKKFALFRSYKQSTVLAADAKAKADKALADANARKDQVKTEVNAMMAEVSALITETKDMLDKAPKGKGSMQDIEAYKADIAGAEQALVEANTAFTNGKFLEAQRKANAAKATTMTVKTSIEQAMADRMGRK